MEVDRSTWKDGEGGRGGRAYGGVYRAYRQTYTEEKELVMATLQPLLSSSIDISFMQTLEEVYVPDGMRTVAYELYDGKERVWRNITLGRSVYVSLETGDEVHNFTLSISACLLGEDRPQVYILQHTHVRIEGRCDVVVREGRL